MELKPLFDNVVLKVNEDKPVSSIIIPESAKDRPEVATVVACGVGDDDHKMCLSDGDKVLYNKFAGYEFHLEHTTYILIKQTDILAKVKE